MNDKMKVPVCEASIGEKELANVIDAVKSGWISGYKGRYITEFENRFAAYCGAKYAVTTTSCATALLLSLETMGIEKGDEVITTDFTMIATVAAIIRAGAKPVLVDIDPDTWCLDVDQVRKSINRNTVAIMPVPIYGHPVDGGAIKELAEKNNLIVIEDAAEAIGSEYSPGKRVGSLFDASCFSFYVNKTIQTGEGGMIVTNSESFADKARRFKGYDTDPESRFIHQGLGFNYRMTNVTAAIGCAQMDNIEHFVAMKRAIAEKYFQRLSKRQDLQMPVEEEDSINSFWVFGMMVKDHAKVSRDALVDKLSKMGVETRRFFVPMHKQPALLRLGLFKGSEKLYPVADRVSRQGIYLPNGVTLTSEQISYVCDCIEEILDG